MYVVANRTVSQGRGCVGLFLFPKLPHLAIVRGIVCLISVLVELSSVYEEEGFCSVELIFSQAALVKVFISCRSSLVEILGSLLYAIIIYK